MNTDVRPLVLLAELTPQYTLQIGIDGVQDAKDASDFFQRSKPAPTNYTFSYFEDLYARDAKTPTIVNVSSLSWRNVALYQPGTYTAKLCVGT